MCTLVILRRPDHAWPLLVAGNRDEQVDRPWQPPGRHWPERPEVVAGLDELAGGSWLGVTDQGLVAVVMNRQGSLGPAADRRSRGELVLEALDQGDAQSAAEALTHLNPAAYRSFNLFVGDPTQAFWLRHDSGDQPPQLFPVPAGLHMLTACDLDDFAHPRVRIYLPRFRQASAPEPQAGQWEAWRSLVASRLYPEADGPEAAMNLDHAGGMGTLCSHLVGIPRYPGFEGKPVLQFASGPPDRVAFEPVAL